MKEYIYTISNPRRLLEILVHSQGLQKNTKKDCLCCRATLTQRGRERQLPTFIQCMCHPRCAALGKGFIHLVKWVSWCHGVTQSTDAISSERKLQSHPKASLNPGQNSTNVSMSQFEISFNITWLTLFFIPQCSGRTVVIHPNSHSECTTFSNTYITLKTEAKLFFLLFFHF